jgi:hypothetical protein
MSSRRGEDVWATLSDGALRHGCYGVQLRVEFVADAIREQSAQMVADIDLCA